MLLGSSGLGRLTKCEIHTTGRSSTTQMLTIPLYRNPLFLHLVVALLPQSLDVSGQ